MFKETKISPPTLQRALKDLESSNSIKRNDIGHMKVDYEITAKGKKLLGKLEELKEILR